MLKIVSNKIKCKFCGDVVESKYTHDFKQCKCGKCATDGGLEYIRRAFATENPEDSFEDLSIYIDENGNLIHASDSTKVIEAEKAEPEEVIIKRDKNGKPISGRYPWGKSSC